MNDGGNRRYTDEDILGRFENPQRLYARPPGNERMIQSGLHGNMQSAAEMPAPDESGSSDSASNSDERS
jgi:hypothetical protein